MEKKITFEKQIRFPTMIGEISAISLEPNLRFLDDSNVEGDLLLRGKYKLTEASRLEEDFEYQIPMEITLQNKLDLDTAKIDITDFTYDIEEEDFMNCHIELMVVGDEIVEELEENRECDDNPQEKEIEIPKIEDNSKEESKKEEREEGIKRIEKDITNDENEEEMIEESHSVESSLFMNFSDENESFGTFLVYIVRQNESINSIIEKYHTTLEDVEQYNDITNIDIGSKLIIPLKNE